MKKILLFLMLFSSTATYAQFWQGFLQGLANGMQQLQQQMVQQQMMQQQAVPRQRTTVKQQNARNMDYLLDPNYAAQQVQQQNYQEYMQATNGGKTMTYDEWYAAKANAWAEVQKESRSTSSSTSSSSSYSSSSCSLCHGKGTIIRDSSVPLYGAENTKVYCNTCDKYFWRSTGHSHVTCPQCHGR